MTVSMLRKATAPFRDSKLPDVPPVDGEDATVVVPSLSHAVHGRCRNGAWPFVSCMDSCSIGCAPILKHNLAADRHLRRDAAVQF